jgi:hypothetical protein
MLAVSRAPHDNLIGSTFALIVFTASALPETVENDEIQEFPVESA